MYNVESCSDWVEHAGRVQAEVKHCCVGFIVHQRRSNMCARITTSASALAGECANDINALNL